MHFHPRTPQREKPTEPGTGRPTGSAEEWLGRNRDGKRRLWERLNPRHRKSLHILAEALAAQQSHAQLEEGMRGKFSQLQADVERLVNRASTLLAEVARRTRPRA
ncbi:MAG: hypothetical protein JSS69_17100 [Acidobacteria bacterium]|nr:hypothetical protein [Acidobacteriota bacterium]MBS1867634.1 hypothetical protein [Acidobacteriota bacterium]